MVQAVQRQETRFRSRGSRKSVKKQGKESARSRWVHLHAEAVLRDETGWCPARYTGITGSFCEEDKAVIRLR